MVTMVMMRMVVVVMMMMMMMTMMMMLVVMMVMMLMWCGQLRGPFDDIDLSGRGLEGAKSIGEFLFRKNTGTVIESTEDQVLVANGTRCYACNAPFILGECEV
jgi:hypothetical protein